ncbi:hypothetical protein FISHEDRAFT_71149 [Fistulina hepatica ATCC 64428]|nr:hypothetical protein FISHEDRAFT_71149 [Fistulina hepatica ATCC 64428]
MALPNPVTSSLRRPHSAIENIEISDNDIIDVDALEDEQPPRQRRRIEPGDRRHNEPSDVIVIDDDDSDDDVFEVITEMPPGPGQARHQRRRRLRSPPPPPRAPSVVPMVPVIPARWRLMNVNVFGGPDPQGPVRPNREPLPFERDLERLQETAEPALAAAQAQAPPRQPAPMALGGAIISDNNARLQRERDEHLQRTEDQRRSLIDRIVQHFFVDYDPDGARVYTDPRLRAYGAVFQREKPEPDYKPEYTHPEPPEPGFTNDFGSSSDTDGETSSASRSVIVIDDDDERAGPSNQAGPSSVVAPAESVAKTDVLLSCASCHHRLVLGGDLNKLGLEHERKRKLWGLRCGHVVDGECHDNLFRPPPAKDVPRSPQTAEGKGQADVHDDSTTMYYSIRSRLRSFASSAALPHIASTPKAHKVRAMVRETTVQTHEWRCPVCARRHVSALVGDEWKDDTTSGAIQIFV